MTRDWYINNGYNVSASIDQAQIDRAEREIVEAYVLPILPAAVDPENDDELAHAVASIAYLRLLQMTLKVTRSGTKEKTAQGSVNADQWAPIREQAPVAAMAVRKLRSMDGAVSGASVRDICGISVKSFFHQ